MAETEFAGSDRFEVRRRLGAGGMGVVYEAWDRERGALVALKTLRTLGPEALVRFKNEFRALQDIRHPNLVGLGELFEQAGEWFFTMELVDGVSFLSWVRAEDLVDAPTPQPAPPAGSAPVLEDATADMMLAPTPRRFDEGRLRAALADLARGLAALHTAGKVHRDIKPSNVLVARDGRVVILDFGLIADLAGDVAGDVLGPERRIVGSASHMAPEQTTTHLVGPAADWYSVGVILYQCLTGCLPFVGKPEHVVRLKQRSEPTPPSEIVADAPPDLAALAEDLLRTDARARPDEREILRRLRVTRETATGNAAMQQFVGRALELADLDAALADARGGMAATVLVRGESGVGKSALVRRWCELAAAETGVVVLAGRCHERESVPYRAVDGVIDALASHLTTLPDARTLLPRDAGLLGQVFPVMRRVAAIAQAPTVERSGLDPQELRQRVFTSLRELFARLARQRPMVIAIDDLQWADADGLALLGDVLRTPRAPGLLLVATMRTGSSTGNELAALTRALPGDLRERVIEGLPPEDARALARLVAERLGAPPGRESPIADEARGHPMFIDELMRAHHELGATNLATLDLGGALRARIARLDAPSRALLELLAVAGAPLAQETAAHAAQSEFADFAERASLLRSAHLVRTTGARRGDSIEPYHDRVREAVLAHLDKGAQQGWHQRLALALEATRRADAEALAVHWRGEGDLGKAAHYAALAADEAQAALAFDRAARLYRLSLELRTDRATEGSLRARLADALANAGRGREAAAAYLDAAPHASSVVALDLRRRAAEQLLRSGHIDEGLSALGDVLSAVGLTLPTTPNRALASLLVRRAQVRMRGLSFVERDASLIPPEELERIDICWSVAAALGLVDTIRGAYFQTRCLLYALAAGEPSRVARALAIEAAYAAVAGGPGHERTADVVGRCDALAQKIGQPYTLGWAATAAGISAALEGRWEAGHEECTRAETLFREKCTGVVWETATVHWFALWSLAYLGGIRLLSSSVRERLHEAEGRGDRYAAICHSIGLPNLAWLAADRPDEARRVAADAMSKWSQRHFHVEHWWDTLAQAQIDLYAGDAKKALALVEERWKGLDSSLLLRVQLTRIEALQLRARVSLQLARGGSDAKGSLLAAERDARKIAGEKMPWSSPLAELLLAGAASVRGDDAAAQKLLTASVAGLDAAAMALYANAARWRLGALLGGDAGATMKQTADGWLRAEGILDPARMVAMLTPGFAD